MMSVHLAKLYPVELILMLLIASANVFVLNQPFCSDSRLNREPQPICPGDSLQIFCVVSGSGSTVYNGDALPRQCPDNGITLFHNRFPNVSLSCGNAVGQGLTVDVVGNQYKSQLLLNFINCNQNSTFIICQHDDGSNSRDICKYPLIIQESSPPDYIHLINISFDRITFSWNNTASMCSAISYIINSSGCGTCPTTTNLTTATCFNVRFNSSERCIFIVITSICESDAASRSTPFNATFRDLVSVPDIISVVPTYSQQSLLVSFELHFQIKISLPIPPDANVTAISYNVSYTNSMSNELCRLNTIDPITECFNDTCRGVLKVMTTSCQSLDITVTLSSNVYGIIKTSLPLHIDGTNKFVMVTYNSATKNLTCTFLIKDTSEKTCNVSYVVCESNATKTAQGIFDVLQPSVVDVQLQLSDQNVYCYSVTAANDTFIAIVEGNINTTTISDPPSMAGVIGGSVAAVVFSFMAVALLIIAVLCIKFKGKSTSQSATENHPLGEVMLCTTQQPPKQAKQVEDMETTFVELEPVSDSFRLYTVDKPTGLRKYVEERIPEVEFSRGCAFYEFKNSTEDVDKTSRVILMDKETKELFSGQNAYDVAFKSCTKKLISDTRFEIYRPNNERYIIFVQDSGSGSRFLDKDSYLLVDIKPRILGLTEVPSDQYQRLKVTKDSQLYSFITEKNNLVYERGCAFYEFSHASEDISGDKEVLLLDVKSDKLYTGERAKTMVGVPGDGIRNQLRGKNNWRVFIQSRCTGNRHLDRNTMLLYQIKPPKDDHAKSHNQQKKRQSVDNYLVADSSGDFKVIPVHESCSLRKFIDEHEETNGYERKCAYFEFCHDEEDITDKDIILIDTKGKLHLGGEAIEMIGGHVSTIGVKKPNLPDFPGVFIQCNGPGYSVHIEAGSSIIYKDPKIGNLVPVDLDEYDKFEVKTTSELRRFVEDKVGEFKRGAAFYQFTCEEEDISKDKIVLLMSKDGNAMYTGAAACNKIGAPGKGIRRPPDDFQYTVFVQNKSRGSRCLLEGTILLYKKNFEDDNEGTVLK